MPRQRRLSATSAASEPLSALSHQAGRAGAAPAWPEGLCYHPGLISGTEEEALIAHLQELSFAPFQFGIYEGKRRIVSFGARYDFTHQRLEEAAAIPDWLQPFARRCEQVTGLSPGSIRHALCTEYAAGAGIGWHRDKRVFDEVLGISLRSACKLRLRRRRGEKWERFSLDAQPRSLYVLRGPARNVWEHSIPPVEDLRYSITFRSMARGES
jgi:alkylated DNA repair dioxygenase AlkB